MIMKNLIRLLPCLTLITTTAFAVENKGGLFVEPMLTYERGEAEVDFPLPIGNSDSDIQGLGLGARLGLHAWDVVFIGADARYSRPNFSNDDADIDAESTAYNYGPMVGLQLPTTLSIRVWANYIMGGQMDVEEDQNIDLKFKDASGYRVGGGIRLGMVSVNLEYQAIKYDETELQDAGFFSRTTNDVTQDNNSYILSVSFPISL